MTDTPNAQAPNFALADASADYASDLSKVFTNHFERVAVAADSSVPEIMRAVIQAHMLTMIPVLSFFSKEPETMEVHMTNLVRMFVFEANMQIQASGDEIVPNLYNPDGLPITGEAPDAEAA